MKAKTIKALDGLIAALEECKDALEAEANKSGDSADDGDNGKVSGRNKKTGAGAVSGKGAKSRPASDDDASVDGDDDPDADDDELPEPTAAVKKSKTAPAKKTTAAKGKTKKGDDEPDLDTVKEKLTAVMNEESLGKARVLKILKKYSATRSAELDESDYAAVIKACNAALAETATDEDDDV